MLTVNEKLVSKKFSELTTKENFTKKFSYIKKFRAVFMAFHIKKIFSDEISISFKFDIFLMKAAQKISSDFLMHIRQDLWKHHFSHSCQKREKIQDIK